MFKYISFLGDRFLNNTLDLRIRMFNVLAITGTIVSIFGTVAGIISNEGMVSILSNFAIFAVSLGLLIYASKSSRRQTCYLITIIGIFIVGFTFIFFFGGGYYGAMPFFFVFAVVFTMYMLEGKTAISMGILEIIYYTGLCIFAYYRPDIVQMDDSASYRLTEVLLGFLSVSTMIGGSMFFQFRMYNIQQKELEAAREEAIKLSEAKSNFLANMSHEIRTPINVILGMNEIILRESESVQIKKYSTNIQRAGKTLLLLINNVLDVSKIESGKFSVSEEEYKTADLIAELSMVGKEQAGKYGLSFNTEADSCLPRVLVGDPVHLTQIIVNFLGNAVKYTKQGSVTLIFSQKPTENSNEIYLRISVADTGIGIKRENISVLFDAFTRADMLSNRYIEGTGLGLAIAKALAELMGGHVYVESQWGVGSTFSVEMRQKVADTAPIDIECVRSHDVSVPTVSRVGFIAPNARVLVVDDNLENLQVIRSLLSRTLMHIETAESGVQCMKKVEAGNFDVILMDYMMPNMNGVDTLQRLKRIAGFNTPVVALTANIIAGTKEKLLRQGFVKYISKPVMWDVLEATLLSILPHSLVSIRAVNTVQNIHGFDKSILSDELLKYGIDIESGIAFLGGDMEQYGKLSSFFLESYEHEKSEISALHQRREYEALKFRVHSLKSKSRALGADYLSANAAKIEGMCNYEDEKYINAVLQIMYLEWEHVCEGLSILKDRTSPTETDAENDESSEMYFEKLEKLKEFLKYRRQPDAVSLLESLLQGSVPPGDKYNIIKIRQLIDNFKFKEAEKLLEEIMGGLAYGE